MCLIAYESESSTRSRHSRGCSVMEKSKPTIQSSEQTTEESIKGMYIMVIWNVRSYGLAAYRKTAPSATSVSRIEGH
jgi:hypothetical protein